MPHREILSGIAAYAQAYGAFQQLQDAHRDLLTVGDQKTGVIGEFYGLMYARSKYVSCQVRYAADPSQTGWDLEVEAGVTGPDLKIQIKTVSAYSRTRTITPLFPGWDHLYLFLLSDQLWPSGFWIVEQNDIFRGKKCLTGLRMKVPTNPSSGSQCLPWGENRVEELLTVIRHG